MIELATEKEHLSGAAYIVQVGMQKLQSADTVEEVYKILGNRAFGTTYEVTSPAGLNVDEFISF
jgi:hypothetical protein